MPRTPVSPYRLCGGLLCCAMITAGLMLPASAHGQALLPTVFVGNNAGHNLASFTVNPDGTLQFVGNFASGQFPSSISLSPDGRTLAVSHATSNEIVEELRLFRVNTDSTLTPLLTTLVPDSPLGISWVSNDKLAVTETRLSGENRMRIYSYNEATNSVSQASVVDTGGFNTSLAVTGNYVYANDSGGNVVRGFEMAPDGSLSSVAFASTSPSFPLNIKTSADGRFLYGGGGISSGGRNIVGLEIGADGSLTPIGGTPFQSVANNPAWVAVSEGTDFLFVAHTGDQSIRTFSIDPATGALSYAGHSQVVGSTLSVGDMTVLGDLLLTVDKSSAIDGQTGVLSFRINPDGSLTRLGIWDTGGGRPELITAWAGIPEPSSALLGLLGVGGLLCRRR